MTKKSFNSANRSSVLLRRSVVIALTGALLSGCVVGPNYSKPALFSAITSIGQGQKPRPLPDLSEWWKKFNDPTLDRIVELALEQNLSVASAKAKVIEARSSYQATGGAELPTVNGSSSVRRSGTLDSSSSNLFQSGVDASWEIDLFGANRRTREAARAGLDAAQEELRAAKVSLVADIATNYINARGYQERIALSHKTVKSQRNTRDLVRMKQELGSASELDVANASGTMANTEAGVPDLQIAYQQSLHRLGVLSGQQPKALTAMFAKARSVPRASYSIKNGISADAISARPDIRVAERQLAKATANIGIAEAARYPSISLSGSISSSASVIGDLAKSSTIGWALGPSLTVPIFNNGRLKANVAVAEAQRDQSFIQYQSAILTALEDVENALVSSTQNRNKRTKIADAVKSYRQVYDLTRVSYESGASDFLDVLTAERSLFGAETNAIENRVAIALDFVSLNRALGSGWDGDKSVMAAR